VAVRLSRREFVDLFGVILAAVSILSLVVAVALPRYGLDHLRGDTWRGVFETKNGLGRIACLTLAVWLYRARAYRTSRFGAGLVSLVAVIDVYFSQSRTSIAVSLFLVLLLAAAPLLQGDFRIATAASMFLLVAAGSMTLWLYDHAEKVLSSVGTSENLTGRTPIWRAAWYMIHRDFWFGYGYNAFWTGIDGPSGALWAIVGGTPPHAHNGFLDIWLDLGAVGVFLLACFLAWIGIRAWLSMRTGRADNMLSLVFLTFLLAFNFSESSFLSRNSIFWLMFVLAAAWVAPERKASYAESDVPDLQLRRSKATGAV
jgi:exopolysaccharide production protein ExoQ